MALKTGIGKQRAYSGLEFRASYLKEAQGAHDQQGITADVTVHERTFLKGHQFKTMF